MRLLNYLNPKYHWHRFMDDVAHVRQAFRERKQLAAPANPLELQALFRGKLFSTFMVSGPAGFIGLAVAGFLQTLTRSAWVGLFATIFFVFLFTTSAFQTIWFADNKRIYKHGGRFGWAAFVEMQRDLIPLHLFGIKIGLTFALIGIPINAIIIGAVQYVNAQAAERLPVPIMVFVLDTILVQGTFMRVMGDYFDQHSKVLGERHFDLLANGAPPRN